MGWLSNIFKFEKPVETAKEFSPQEVSLEDLIVVLEKKIQEKNSLFEKDLENMHRKLVESSHNFSRMLNDLQNSKGPDKIDDALMNVAKSYRSTLIRAFRNSFMEFEKPVGYTIEDFGKYFNRCASSLREAESGVMRFVQPLKEVFPREMKRLLKSSDDLENAISEISSGLSKKSLEIKPPADALKLAKDFGFNLNKLSETETGKSNLESYVDDLKNSKESLEKKISEFLKSEDWIEHQRKFQEIATIEKRKDEIQSVVVQSIAPLDKAVKRLRRMSSEGIEKFENEKMLELYITNPIEAFLKDSNQVVIKNIISKIKAASEKGKLEIDTKKEQKILEKMSAVESGDFLFALRKDYDELEKAARKLEEELAARDLRKIKFDYENELKNLDSKIEEAQSKLKNIDSSLVKLREEREDFLSKLKEETRKVLGYEAKLTGV